MRSLVGIFGVLAVVSVSQPAAAVEYPWCAHYGGRNAATNCGFVSFKQCRETIAGLGGYCARNPFYAAEPARPRHKRVHVE